MMWRSKVGSFAAQARPPRANASEWMHSPRVWVSERWQRVCARATVGGVAGVAAEQGGESAGGLAPPHMMMPEKGRGSCRGETLSPGSTGSLSLRGPPTALTTHHCSTRRPSRRPRAGSTTTSRRQPGQPLKFWEGWDGMSFFFFCSCSRNGKRGRVASLPLPPTAAPLS